MPGSLDAFAWLMLPPPGSIIQSSRAPGFDSLSVLAYPIRSPRLFVARSQNLANRPGASAFAQPPRSANQRGTAPCEYVTIGVIPASWQAARTRR